MPIIVTGSIATDHLMRFPGRFAELILPDQLATISLSFLVDELVVHRGGVAANIAYGIAQLGDHPVLVGAVGADFGEYRIALERQGVDCQAVLVSQTAHTARFVCTTDQDQCQIASFYTGAMAQAREIDLAALIARLGGTDLVIVSPNDPEAMLRHTGVCRDLGVPFVADPSQQLARISEEQARRLIDGAAYLVTNEYERKLLSTRTGLTEAQIEARVGIWITTLGAAGVQVTGDGREPIRVPAVPVDQILDPTGGGDAFRAGFFAARSWGLAVERAAQVGCTLAAVVLGTVGTQEYTIDRAAFLELLERSYGPAATAEVALDWAEQPR